MRLQHGFPRRVLQGSALRAAPRRVQADLEGATAHGVTMHDEATDETLRHVGHR